MDKLAIFSDVHGNLGAFEAVLEDAQSQGATEYLCLGDQGNFGPQPAQALDALETLDCQVVMGNTDERLLEPRTLANFDNPSADTPLTVDIEQWCSAQLSDEHKAFVNTFEPHINLEFEGLHILAYHGSPKSFNNLIVPETDDETLDNYFEGFEADLYVGGHTHIQFSKRYHDKRLMNPGSVGLSYVIQKDGAALNFTVAEYALLDAAAGQANVTLRRVPYSLKRLEQAVTESNMPHGKRWLENFRQA